MIYIDKIAKAHVGNAVSGQNSFYEISDSKKEYPARFIPDSQSVFRCFSVGGLLHRKDIFCATIS